jgi:hypothetical protein
MMGMEGAAAGIRHSLDRMFRKRPFYFKNFKIIFVAFGAQD